MFFIFSIPSFTSYDKSTLSSICFYIEIEDSFGAYILWRGCYGYTISCLLLFIGTSVLSTYDYGFSTTTATSAIYGLGFIFKAIIYFPSCINRPPIPVIEFLIPLNPFRIDSSEILKNYLVLFKKLLFDLSIFYDSLFDPFLSLLTIGSVITEFNQVFFSNR